MSKDIRLLAAGMYGLLSEIHGRGAHYGDPDLIDRVSMAIQDYDSYLALLSTSKPLQSGPQREDLAFSGSESQGRLVAGVPLTRTLRLMLDLHKDQVDKAGHPYIFHPYAVMCRLHPYTDNYTRHLALLHDAIEDTDMTMSRLSVLGYTAAFRESLDLLTRSSVVTYRAYMHQILDSGDVDALQVKLADMYDNSADDRRYPGDECDSMKRDRYEPWIPQFEAALNHQLIPFRGPMLRRLFGIHDVSDLNLMGATTKQQRHVFSTELIRRSLAADDCPGLRLRIPVE